MSDLKVYGDYRGIHFIIVMIRWTRLSPWEFISLFHVALHLPSSRAAGVDRAERGAGHGARGLLLVPLERPDPTPTSSAHTSFTYLFWELVTLRTEFRATRPIQLDRFHSTPGPHTRMCVGGSGARGLLLVPLERPCTLDPEPSIPNPQPYTLHAKT